MPKPRVSQRERWQFLLSLGFLSMLQCLVPPPVCKFFLLVTFINVSNPITEPRAGTVLLWFRSDILMESKHQKGLRILFFLFLSSVMQKCNLVIILAAHLFLLFSLSIAPIKLIFLMVSDKLSCSETI